MIDVKTYFNRTTAKETGTFTIARPGRPTAICTIYLTLLPS